MSWAEIKKAINSNLDVPLNKLIEERTKNKDGRNSRFKKYKHATWQNVGDNVSRLVLDVSGKGRLKSLYYSGFAETPNYRYQTNSRPYLKITVDGKPYIDLRFISYVSYESQYQIMAKFKLIHKIVPLDTNAYTPFPHVFYVSGGQSEYNAVSIDKQSNDEEVEIPSNSLLEGSAIGKLKTEQMVINAYSYANDGIFFDESLKIEYCVGSDDLHKNSTDIGISFLYELED